MSLVVVVVVVVVGLMFYYLKIDYYLMLFDAVEPVV
jgi:hypothetical protein